MVKYFISNVINVNLTLLESTVYTEFNKKKV